MSTRLNIEFGVAREEARGEAAHQETSHGKDAVSGGDQDCDDEDFVGGKKGKI